MSDNRAMTVARAIRIVAQHAVAAAWEADIIGCYPGLSEDDWAAVVSEAFRIVAPYDDFNVAYALLASRADKDTP